MARKATSRRWVKDPLFIKLYNAFRWKMIPNCTGRYTCRDHKAVSHLTPTNLLEDAGIDSATILRLQQYYITFDKGQRKDPIYVVPFADDGLTGLISYVKRGEDGLRAINVVLKEEDLVSPHITRTAQRP